MIVAVTTPLVAPLKLFAFAILMLASVAVNAMSVPLIPVISVRLIADNRSETPPLRRSTLVKLITAFALKPVSYTHLTLPTRTVV